MYMYVYTCTHMYIRAQVCLCVYMYTHVCKSAGIPVCTYMYAHVGKSAGVPVCVCGGMFVGWSIPVWPTSVVCVAQSCFRCSVSGVFPLLPPFPSPPVLEGLPSHIQSNVSSVLVSPVICLDKGSGALWIFLLQVKARGTYL